ncbi:HMCN1 protein, partial [Ptilonorhynchus violaceus]|nr:HMCN1 protein [Ptilonorhynchus violaceus]
PEGASTLAFVFDVTGSMYDDLVQVIEGASKILETSLKRPKRPLYNFALVPFHDPEIGPVTITTDPKKFQFELRELYVQGGGDCPEMSIGAIKIALEISLPGSFIYVFTDARSKDYRLTHEVLQLIQQKQSQVVFVLTGDCDDRDHIGYKVYEEIASTSSGQVFHLDKKQVNEVLKWVEEAVQASKVHLLSTDHLSMAVNTWQIPFDPSLKEVTVSLSGPSPAIEIHNPLGKQLSKGSGLNELLNIQNSAKVVNVKDPEPGTWTIKTSSSGRHSVRITGLSTIDFRAGFSRKPTLDFKKTSSRPVQGIPTFVLLNTTGILLPARVDRLELLSITGELLKTLPVKYYPDRKPYGLWNISDFIPPDEAFFVRITGYDKDDYLFQRVSSVSFSSITPDAPKVTMPMKTPGYYLQPGSVPCHVESLIPFTQRFTKNGVKLGVDQFFKESSSMSWDIAQVSVSDEGFYECVATSTAGTGRAQTFLDVSEPPPVIQVPHNVTVVPGAGAVLSCLALSSVRYNLSWQRHGRDARLQDPLRVRLLSNLSLEVRPARLSDAGSYSCIAANEGGAAAASVFLTVQEPPRLVISPKNQTFTEGSEVSIRCSATGYPKPTVVWTHNDMFIVGSSRYRLTPEGTLIIRKAIPKDAGIYGCLASNSAGTEKQTSTLTYIEGPSLTIVQSEILVGLGDTTVMECKTTGIPPPQVKWFKELRASAFLIIDTHRGLLKIQETQDLDAGDYTCVATNDAGTASGKITLDVGSPPVFTQEPGDDSADLGSNVTLPCYVQGYPEPRVKWRRLDGAPLFSRPFALSAISQLRTGALAIQNLWVSDEGTYVCEAENQFGRIQSRPATVTVTGLVTPLIGASPATANVIEGQQLTLPCVLLAGNPIPDRRWIKNSVVLVPNPYVSVRSDGSLQLERVRLQDGGDYTCMASNVAGTSNSTTTVNVYVLPVIQHGQQIFSTIEGIPVTLPCKASGVPKPSIVWSKVIPHLSAVHGERWTEHKKLYSNGPEHQSCMVLHLYKYVYSLQLLNVFHIIVKPRVSRPGDQQGNAQDKPIELSVIAGEDVTLPCEVRSLPPPIITWAKEMQLISPFSPRHTFLPSGSMKISETQVSDSGMYICVATNIAGNVTQSVKLSVHVPPRIQRGPRVLKVQTRQRVELPCSAQGVPAPSVTWFRGRSAVPTDGGQFLQSLDGALGISSVQLPDAGIYKCVATNVAGSDTVEVTVQVQVPPSIKGGNITTEVSVLLNNLINLECETKGIPVPTITWYKDGHRVMSGPQALYVDRGQFLQIPRAQVSDSAQYTCRVSSAAGAAEKLYHVDVYVPPSIAGYQQMPENISIVEKNPISLVCEASGIPLPAITWLKNGRPITSNNSVRILSGGRTLRLGPAGADDAGLYTCVVTNAAGEARKDFRLSVLVAPSIMGADSQGNAEDVTVILNSPTSLVCEAYSYPPATITWLKDGNALESSRNIRILPGGRTLQILNAEQDNAGRYTCIATNEAGETLKHYEVKVYIPPTISKGDISGMGLSPKEVKIKVNHSLTLECEAHAIPAAAISWYKDGQANAHVLIQGSGRSLHIREAQVSDTGRYTCLASNIAGEDELEFDVNIQVDAGRAGESKDVIVNNPLSLYCETNAVPPPVLTWFKDGHPLSSSDRVLILPGGRVLQVARARAGDAGRYACVAVNEAGQDSIHYDVRVLFPPTIASSKAEAEELTALLDTSLNIECTATGTPPPQLHWLKNGLPLSVSSQIRLLSAGQILRLARVQISDTGVYTCVASNRAGVDNKHYNLRVLVPPSLDNAGGTEEVAVLRGRAAALGCVSDGSPVPSLAWLKDGLALSLGAHLTSSNHGMVLQVLRAEPADTGKYTCVASNDAGETSKHFVLTVLEPPHINGSDEPEELSVIVNNPLELLCISSGIPVPKISWMKDGRPLLQTDNIHILREALRITSAQVEDTGRYTCLASSPAGDDDKEYLVRVHVAPTIRSTPQTAVVHINASALLECAAEGVPTPRITWRKDGAVFTGNNTRYSVLEDGSLHIHSAQVADTGRFVCMATNAAGTERQRIDLQVLVPPTIAPGQTNITVTVNVQTTLPCETTGIPRPAISWKKNGHLLSVDQNQNTYRLLSSGSLVIISPTVDDTAVYECSVSNDAGEDQRAVELTVQVPPSIADEATDLLVTKLSPVMVSCTASGVPIPTVHWTKNG